VYLGTVVRGVESGCQTSAIIELVNLLINFYAVAGVIVVVVLLDPGKRRSPAHH
jgi:hypothetical protein